MKRIFALNIILLFLLISCEPESSTKPLIAEDMINVSYGGNESNKMDIYLPANRNGNTRTIILIHGGYWYGGNKSELTTFAKYFRDKGFACVNMNYRLTHTADNNIHPAQINDVGKAIEYISVKSDEFHIASGKAGLLGVSAGAHIALLYTYASNTNGKVKTVVSVSGPTNFVAGQTASPALIQVLEWLIGSKNPEAYLQASPIAHVNASSQSTFLAHGKLDNIVPYQQSVDLKTKLDQFKVKNKFRSYDNSGHDLNSKPEIVDNLLIECADWFDENIR